MQNREGDNPHSAEEIEDQNRRLFIEEFARIRETIEKVRNERELAELQLHLETVDDGLRQAFPDPVASDAAVAVWAAREQLQFEKLAEIARANFPKPEPVIEGGSNGGEEEYLRLNRLAADITYHFLDDLEKLKPREGQSADERFVEVARQVWTDFVYGAKFDREGNPRPLAEQDMDVRTSMFLLAKAGFRAENLLKAKPVRQGMAVPGKLNIDTGGREGVQVDETLTVQIENKHDPYNRPAVFIDNHPRNRPDRESSAARELYELLERSGFLKEASPEDKRALEMMVRFSVDSDNASFPESAPGARLADFGNSDRTLRGLAHYMKTEDIFDYLRDFKGTYGEAAVGHKFTPQELDKYGLNKPREELGYFDGAQRKFISRTPQERQRQNIEQARERLGKPREELLKEGAIIESRLGSYVADFVEKPGDKLRAGHDAAQSYGYDGYISYNLRDGGFLVNNMRGVDLSRDELVQELATRAGAVTVRGAMVIKPAGKPDIKFAEILRRVGMQGEPAGKIKEALKKPIPLEELPGSKKLLKKYFDEEAPEIWKAKFTTLDRWGHLVDRSGTPSESTYVHLEEWEKIKQWVRTQLAERQKPKPKQEPGKEDLGDLSRPPAADTLPTPGEGGIEMPSERDRIIAELRADVENGLRVELAKTGLNGQELERELARLVPEEVEAILKEIEKP